MKLFKISVKFEQDGRWSDRKVDLEGYLVQKNETDGMVEGYVEVLYDTEEDAIRFVKGILTTESLVYMQLCNNLSPICYCFPNTAEEGFWSDFSYNVGFFPCILGFKCSDGHAMITIKEITDEEQKEQETLSVFDRYEAKANWENRCLLYDAQSLTDFLEPGVVFQMKLHCGKW